MPFAFSSAFAAFVAPARDRVALWRAVAGTLVAAGIWFAAVLALLGAAPSLGIDAPRGRLLLYLASFAGLALGTAFAARVLHARRPATLLGPGGFRPRHFGAGVAAFAALALATGLVAASLAPPVRQADPGAWMRLLPLAAALVFVQTAAEELLFRGYLTQALAARFHSPLIWAGIPSIAFGALHWDGAAYGADAWLAVVAAATVGLALCDVTAVTGNLSAAIGLHFANNVVALLVVAMPGATDGLALYLSPVDPAHPMRAWLVADVAATLAAWAAWRLVLALRGRRLHSRDRGSI
jgi:membrane protease YdiL (CAAX protease family)